MGVVTVSGDVFGRITVSFPYDPRLVAKAKAIEGHKWHPAEKHWSFPDSNDTLTRILESFDAIITDRLYRKGLTFDAAFAELKRNACSQFDSDVVEVL